MTQPFPPPSPPRSKFGFVVIVLALALAGGAWWFHQSALQPTAGVSVWWIGTWQAEQGGVPTLHLTPPKGKGPVTGHLLLRLNDGFLVERQIADTVVSETAVLFTVESNATFGSVPVHYLMTRESGSSSAVLFMLKDLPMAQSVVGNNGRLIPTAPDKSHLKVATLHRVTGRSTGIDPSPREPVK